MNAENERIVYREQYVMGALLDYRYVLLENIDLDNKNVIYLFDFRE